MMPIRGEAYSNYLGCAGNFTVNRWSIGIYFKST